MRTLAVLLLPLALLSCDSSRPHVAALPTVPAPEASPSLETAFITCHDARGKGPDRQVPLHHTDAPQFCFIGGECFYACQGMD